MFNTAIDVPDMLSKMTPPSLTVLKTEEVSPLELQVALIHFIEKHNNLVEYLSNLAKSSNWRCARETTINATLYPK